MYKRNKDNKILMICSTFYPENNPRAVQCYELYNALTKKGYDVNICITPKRKIYDNKNIKQLINSKATKEKSFVRTNYGFPGAVSKAICFWIGQKGFYIYNSWMDKNIRLDEYKAVLAIAAPFYNIYVTGRLLRKGTRIRAICDNGDPFYRPYVYSPIVRHLQISAFRQFDYICFPVKEAYGYYSKYADEKKLKVIPQGRDFSSVKTKEYKKNKVPTFAYAGCFFMDIRNPEFFLKILSNFNIPFKFILYTETVGEVYEKILLKYQDILEERMEIHSFLPRLDCIYELSGMDFLIDFKNRDSIQSPSKLIDYSLAGRPILSVKPEYDNEERFKKFVNGDYENQTKVQLDNYDISKVVEKYIEMIEG